MEYLCYVLGQMLRNDDRAVIDKTGLTGNYDFMLTFLPDPPPGFDKANLPPELLDRPTLFDALRQQLGLKLKPQKGPVTYYVIDSVEKPQGRPPETDHLIRSAWRRSRGICGRCSPDRLRAAVPESPPSYAAQTSGPRRARSDSGPGDSQ